MSICPKLQSLLLLGIIPCPFLKNYARLHVIWYTVAYSGRPLLFWSLCVITNGLSILVLMVTEQKEALWLPRTFGHWILGFAWKSQPKVHQAPLCGYAASSSSQPQEQTGTWRYCSVWVDFSPFPIPGISLSLLSDHLCLHPLIVILPSRGGMNSMSQ